MSAKKNVTYKCPYCDRRYKKEDLVKHIDTKHEDMIPEGYTALRITFNVVNKKPLDYSGRCTECKGPTKWDENKGRYNRQCDNPACKKAFIAKFEANMLRTKGVKRISATPEGQEKMLANRKISGKYKFQNGVEKTYTGKYELKALEFMDQVMNIDPDDILSPGPVLEYMYENVKHFYITDFYYIPYDLIIEVKDGGKNPNKRSMPEYRAKQIAKEKFIIENTKYNYLRLTDNDLSQLLSVFMDLKMQLVDGTNDRVVHVNEAMNALMTGYIPGIKDTDQCVIVNYMMNNVFADEPKRGMAVADNLKLDNMFSRNSEGCLAKFPLKQLENCTYEVYLVDKDSREVSEALAPYINEFVEEGFIYETIFGKKMYDYDQIKTEDIAHETLDFYKGMQLLNSALNEYLMNGDYSSIIPIKEAENYNIFQDLVSSNYIVEANNIKIPVSTQEDIPLAKQFINGLQYNWR